MKIPTLPMAAARPPIKTDDRLLAGLVLGTTAPEHMKRVDAGVAARRKFLAEQKEEFPWFDCLGEQVRYKPGYTDRRHDRVEVHIKLRPDAMPPLAELNEEEQAGQYMLYAIEWTSHPWMRASSTSHWVFTCRDTREKVQVQADRAGVKLKNITEDPYAEPTLWHAWVGDDLEDVIKLWKARKE